MSEPVGGDVRAAGDYVGAVLTPGVDRLDSWETPAGILQWSCSETIAHVIDCLTWYAALLARQAPGDVEAAAVSATESPSFMLDAVLSGAAVLAAVVDNAPPAARAWHPYGVADGSGFAAMGCDEMLVHGFDVAATLGLEYEPPRDLCERVVRRLFPWTPAGCDPWAGLLWANGRAPLGDAAPETQWLWQCAPLEDWDGLIRRRS